MEHFYENSKRPLAVNDFRKNSSIADSGMVSYHSRISRGKIVENSTKHTNFNIQSQVLFEGNFNLKE